MYLGEVSAVVTVGLNVTVLSPGNGVLSLGIPWSLVSVADLCLNVFMEAEIVKVGTVEARMAEAGTTEVGTVEPGKVGNSMVRDTKVRVAKEAGFGDTKVGEALDRKYPTSIATAPSGASQLMGYGANVVLHPRCTASSQSSLLVGASVETGVEAVGTVEAVGAVEAGGTVEALGTVEAVGTVAAGTIGVGNIAAGTVEMGTNEAGTVKVGMVEA